MSAPEPILISTIEAGLVLRTYTPEDAETVFALIDRNRQHLSQHGDETAKKYPDLASFLQSITHPANPNKIRLGIWKGETPVGSINLTSSAG